MNNSTNGSPLSQREFSRFLLDHKDDLKELKRSIELLNKKVDKLSTDTIPEMKQQTAVLSTKSKLVYGLLVSGLTTLISVVFQVVKSLL